MISENISIVELGWTLVSYIGGSASLWAALFFLHKALEIRQAHLNGGLKWLAWGRFTLRLLLVIGQYALAFAGYVQMFFPPANPTVPVSIQAIITLLCIIVGNICFSACSVGEVLLLRKVQGMPKRKDDPEVIKHVAQHGS